MTQTEVRGHAAQAVRASRASAIRTRHSRMIAPARRKLSRLVKHRWAQGKMKRRAEARLDERSA